jgi:hypothetical protein
MNTVEYAQFSELLNRGAVVVKVTTVHPLESSGWRQECHERRQRIDNQSQLIFSRGECCQLAAPALVDIDANSVPTRYLAGFARDRGSTDEKPSIRTIQAAQTRFHLSGLSSGTNGPPPGFKGWKVHGMNDGFPPASSRLN